jgi:type I restriction enzyme S subunit
MLDKNKNKGTNQFYLGNSNVRWGGFDLSDLSLMKFKDDEHERYGIKEGDLVVCEGGEPGRCAIWNEELPDMKIQKALHRIRPKQTINNRYLYYWFLHTGRLGLLEPYFTGTTIKHLTGKALKNLEIQLPPLSHQECVAEILGSLDRKIRHNTQTNQTLEQIAQAIFKSWFVDFEPVKAKIAVLEAGGTAEQAELAAMSVISAKDEAALKQLQAEQPEAYAELAQTAALFPSALEASELGEIPEGWSVSTIGESYKVVMGQSPKGTTYNEDKKGTLFYQGRAEFGWRFPSPRLYTTDPKRMASKGDVLMSVRAPVGDLNIALEDCCVGRGLSALLHNSGSTSFTYCQMKDLQRKFDAFNGEGTVFGSINQKDLKALHVIKPDEGLLKLFIDKVTGFDQEIENQSNEIISLISIRDSLLPKLLSGELKSNAEEAA